VAAGLDPLVADMDHDTRLDGADNCVTVANRAQRDSDGDGRGDLCDNCPGVSNAGQTDQDGDGAGDVCDCAPADPSLRAPAEPALFASKTGGSTIVLSWSPVAGADDYSVTVGYAATASPPVTSARASRAPAATPPSNRRRCRLPARCSPISCRAELRLRNGLARLRHGRGSTYEPRPGGLATQRRSPSALACPEAPSWGTASEAISSHMPRTVSSWSLRRR
jgi:hypothetical protein